MIVFKFGYVLKDVVVMNMFCSLHDLCKYDYGRQEHCYNTIWFWLHQALCVMVCPLLGYGCCVLRLRGGSHLQRPLFCDIDRN